MEHERGTYDVCCMWPYLKHVQIASGELVPFIANTILKIKKDLCLNAKRNCFFKSTEEGSLVFTSAFNHHNLMPPNVLVVVDSF